VRNSSLKKERRARSRGYKASFRTSSSRVSLWCAATALRIPVSVAELDRVMIGHCDMVLVTLLGRQADVRAVLKHALIAGGTQRLD